MLRGPAFAGHVHGILLGMGLPKLRGQKTMAQQKYHGWVVESIPREHSGDRAPLIFLSCALVRPHQQSPLCCPVLWQANGRFSVAMQRLGGKSAPGRLRRPAAEAEDGQPGDLHAGRPADVSGRLGLLGAQAQTSHVFAFRSYMHTADCMYTQSTALSCQFRHEAGTLFTQ